MVVEMATVMLRRCLQCGGHTGPPHPHQGWYEGSLELMLGTCDGQMDLTQDGFWCERPWGQFLPTGPTTLDWVWILGGLQDATYLCAHPSGLCQEVSKDAPSPCVSLSILSDMPPLKQQQGYLLHTLLVWSPPVDSGLGLWPSHSCGLAMWPNCLALVSLAWFSVSNFSPPPEAAWRKGLWQESRLASPS